MPRTRNTSCTTSRRNRSNQIDDVLSLNLQREDLAFYVRHELSHEERLVVMLRYAEELPFDEIAGIMSMPQDEVETIHNQIVIRLQRSLKKSSGKNRQLCMAGA